MTKFGRLDRKSQGKMARMKKEQHNPLIGLGDEKFYSYFFPKNTEASVILFSLYKREKLSWLLIS